MPVNFDIGTGQPDLHGLLHKWGGELTKGPPEFLKLKNTERKNPPGLPTLPTIPTAPDWKHRSCRPKPKSTFQTYVFFTVMIFYILSKIHIKAGPKWSHKSWKSMPVPRMLFRILESFFWTKETTQKNPIL